MLSPALHLAKRAFGADAELWERTYFAAVVGRQNRRQPFMPSRQTFGVGALGPSVQLVENTTRDRALLVYVQDLTAVGLRFYTNSQVGSIGSAATLDPQIPLTVQTFVLKPSDQLWAMSSTPTRLVVASETY